MILALSATSGSAQHLRVSSLKRWLPPRGERLRAGEGPQRPPVSPPPSADRGPAPRRGCDSATVTRPHGHRAGGRLRGTALRRWPAGGSFSRFSRLPLGRCQGVSTLACVGPRPPASGAGAALSHAEESEAIPEPKRGGRVSCRPGQAPLQGAGPALTWCPEGMPFTLPPALGAGGDGSAVRPGRPACQGVGALSGSLAGRTFLGRGLPSEGRVSPRPPHPIFFFFF